MGTVGVTNPLRVAAVRRLGVADRTIEPHFQRIGSLIKAVLGVDNASVAIVDDANIYWSDAEASDPFWTRVHPIEKVLSRFIVESGEPLIIDDTRQRPDLGPPANGAKTRALLGVPLRDDDGVVLGSVVAAAAEPRRWTERDGHLLEGLALIAVDELESALDQRAVTQSEELLASVLQLAHAQFALLDDELRFVMINDSMAADSGRPRELFLGERYGDMMPLVAHPLVEMLNNVLATGDSFSDSFIIGPPRSRYGPRRVFDANAFRVMHAGKPHVALISTDITETFALQSRAADLASITRQFSEASSSAEAAHVARRRLRSFFRADHLEIDLWGVNSPPRPPFDAVDRTGDRTNTDTGGQRDLVRTEETFVRRSGTSVVRTARIDVPCLASDRSVVGSFTLRWDHGIRDEELAEADLRTVGDLIGAAVERGFLTEQRTELISELQNALLTPPPKRPGLETFIHHVPASNVTGIGGDWFDVVPISPTTTALVVGDVAGHGPAAAAAMSQIGSTVTQLLLMETPLDRVFAEADRILALRSLSTMATVGIVIVDSEQHTLTSVSAGHPPPLLVEPDGTARLVESSLRPPLCTFDSDVEPSVIPYRPDSRLFIFTDGLIEDRTSGVGAGIDRLLQFAPTVAHLDLDAMVEAFVEALSMGFDDTVVLAARLGDVTSPGGAAHVLGGTGRAAVPPERLQAVQPAASSHHREHRVAHGR